MRAVYAAPVVGGYDPDTVDRVGAEEVAMTAVTVVMLGAATNYIGAVLAAAILEHDTRYGEIEATIWAAFWPCLFALAGVRWVGGGDDLFRPINTKPHDKPRTF